MSQAEMLEEYSGFSQWVTFSLGNERYGIDVQRVKEVLRVTEVSPVPGASAFVLGIINLRGAVVTVVDGRSLFNLDAGDVMDSSRLVIIDVGGKLLGLLVDGVSEVLNLEASEIESSPSVATDEAQNFIQGVTNREDDGLLILVNLDKLFNEEEWQQFS
ncbi:MAG: chemotaxis protein CheW [Immundisolibacteraceae bacterium]|nr:chemotaxis protein CheW [Immundisolibacteraceae bacterium]